MTYYLSGYPTLIPSPVNNWNLILQGNEKQCLTSNVHTPQLRLKVGHLSITKEYLLDYISSLCILWTLYFSGFKKIRVWKGWRVWKCYAAMQSVSQCLKHNVVNRDSPVLHGLCLLSNYVLSPNVTNAHFSMYIFLLILL